MDESKKIEKGDLWGKPEKGKRRTRHWLLSTTKTIARTRNRSYGRKPYERDFTLPVKRFIEGVSTECLGNLLYARFCEVLFDCIIPHAIIARESGMFVQAHDIMVAVNQGMRIGNGEWFGKSWTEYVDMMGGLDWVDKMVQKPLDLYVYGRLENGKRIEPYTLERYINNKIASYAVGLPRYAHRNSPKMNRLIEEFNKDPLILAMSYKELSEKFSVSNNAISAFMKWLRGANHAE